MDNKEHNPYAGAIEYSNMLRDDLLKDSKKAELGFKISLLQIAVFLLICLSVYISIDVVLFFTRIFFLLPIVAWVVGGFSRLWNGLHKIT